MFFLWVKIIKMKKINSNPESLTWAETRLESIDIANSLKALIIKTVNVANIEANEEYLNIKAITNQANINNKKDCIDKAPSIPKNVATPLPPLNFNQNGKIWPKKTIRAERFIKSGKYLTVIITGTNPFMISKTKVRIARILFPVLRTFVAPIFPEPIVLMSCFIKVLVNINPNGIDPDTYENTATKKISIKY